MFKVMLILILLLPLSLNSNNPEHDADEWLYNKIKEEVSIIQRYTYGYTRKVDPDEKMKIYPFDCTFKRGCIIKIEDITIKCLIRKDGKLRVWTTK